MVITGIGNDYGLYDFQRAAALNNIVASNLIAGAADGMLVKDLVDSSRIPFIDLAPRTTLVDLGPRPMGFSAYI